MALLIDNYLKKKQDNVDLEQSRSLLIDKYVKKREIPTVETNIEEKPKLSLLDRIKGFGVGAAKFATRTGIEAANLVTSTLDFTSDFLSRQTEKMIRKPSISSGPLVTIPIGKETERSKKLADDWRKHFDTGKWGMGRVTEKLKETTENWREIEFVQPSEEWTSASNKEKFTKRLPETVLNIGPGIISSLGMFALNPVAGFATSAGSVADEIKTIAVENGVSEQRAEMLGLGTGLLVGWIDKIVPDEVFSPQQKKVFIGSLAKKILKTGLKEAGTEILQEDVQLLVEATIREDITKDEVVTRNLMSGLGGLLGGVGAETTVSFINGVRTGEIGGIDDDTEVKIEKKAPVEKETPIVKKEEASKYILAKDFADAKFGARENQQLGNVDANKITPRDPVDKNSKEYLDLKTDIEKNGFKEPVRVTVEGNEIITTEGSHRVTIAQELGVPVPVIVNKGEISGLKTIGDQYRDVTKVDVKKPAKVVKKPSSDLEVKTKKAVESQIKKTKLITDEKIKNVKNIKDVKNTLKTIRKNFSELTAEVQGRAIVAQEQRDNLDVTNINKLKRIYAVSKKFQEGDIETIRASKHQDLINSVIEEVQEIHPEMEEQEAFEFALDLPTKATAQRRSTAETRELAKKEKTLSKFLENLKKKQEDLNIKQDDALFKQWQAVVDAQEKLIQSIKVPKKQLPVGAGKEKVSRLQARLKGALKKTSKADIEELGLTTYRQMNQDQQIEMASEYVTNNTEEALRVVRGEIDPPDGILQNSVFAALVELGKIDTDIATQVATLTSTRFGQEINILKKILADNPVVMMQDIVKVRIEGYEKRTGRKVNEGIKQEVNKINKKTKPTNKAQWDSFIESIRC